MPASERGDRNRFEKVFYMTTQTKQRPPAKAAKPDTPIRFYRFDLFQKAKDDAAISFADLSAKTGLAKQTVQDVINGDAVKLDAVYMLAKHFRIDWLELFDVDRRIRHGNLAGPKRNGFTN
jgi:hypothetical protein